MMYYYILLSFIQAATEFLPVSSSGHLLFFKGFFHIQEIPIIFDIVVHVGSLTAILVFYGKRLMETLKKAWLEQAEKREQKIHSKLILYIVVSTCVTLLFYTLLKEPIETHYQSPSILFTTYLVTTVILFSTFFMRKVIGTYVWQKSIVLPLIVGLFQGLAIMPGISRSGATISPLLLMGIKKEEAAYYSFVLAIPAILGAFVFKLSDLESVTFLTEHAGIIAISFIVSVLFSYLFLAMLTFILKKGKFWLFAFYTLTMAVVSLIIF